jgi:hypothetical protein
LVRPGVARHLTGLKLRRRDGELLSCRTRVQVVEDPAGASAESLIG